MKKNKKPKHSELIKILLSGENAFEETNNKNLESFSKNKAVFSHEWEFLNNYFIDEKFVHFLKFPENSERFQFINCYLPKTTKDQIYDQV